MRTNSTPDKGTENNRSVIIRTGTVRRRRLLPIRQALVLVCLLLSGIVAPADIVAYGGNHEITSTQGTLTFQHVHNWDSPKLDPLFFDLAHPERFFLPDNDFSFVELRDGKQILFRSPSPALTYLWISPDARFFVGLSDIMLCNPYQLVVWQRDGSLLHREHFSMEVAKLSPEQRRDFATRFPAAERFLSGRYFTYEGSTYLDYALLGVPNNIGDDAWHYLAAFRVLHPYSGDFSSSITNWIHWYDHDHPEVSIVQSGTDFTLHLRSRGGKQMTIPLKK